MAVAPAPVHIRTFWRLYSRNRGAVFGLCAAALLILTAVLAPWLAPHDPAAISRNTFVLPSPQHPFGTDDLGRDMLSAVVFGARTTLLVGFVSALVATAIGVAVGAIAGYFAGHTDDLLMRLTDLFLVIPRFVLVLVVIAILGPSIWNIILVISVFSWPPLARMVRVEFLRVREFEFVQAARGLGQVHVMIMMRHILPNVLPVIIVSASMEVGRAILLEAGVSFLGLGDPQVQSWGRMLNNAQQFLGRSLWMAFFPGAAIFLAVLGLNLVGDGINDALNPRAREV